MRYVPHGPSESHRHKRRKHPEPQLAGTRVRFLPLTKPNFPTTCSTATTVRPRGRGLRPRQRVCRRSWCQRLGVGSVVARDGTATGGVVERVRAREYLNCLPSLWHQNQRQTNQTNVNAGMTVEVSN